MHSKHLPARAFSLLSVALLLGAGLPLFAPGAQAGARVFEEDWELGSSGWTYSTDRPIARQDCTSTHAYRGLCSLEIKAQVRGQNATASRNLALQLEPPGYVVSFWFRNDWPYLRSAGEFHMELGNGTTVKANLSYGPGNQVSVFTDTAGTGMLLTPAGQQWMYAEKTWYRIILKVDLVEDKLRTEVRSTDDTLLASGRALPLPSGATIGTVTFQGSYFGTSAITEAPQKINYDAFAITGPDAPSPPRILKAVPGPGLGQITVDWQAPHDDGGVPVLHYRVYRGDSSDNVTTLVNVTTTRSFVDSGMQNGETHYYAATAVNAAGESLPSNFFPATTFDAPTAPRSLVASPGADPGDVRLSWQAPLSNGGATITSYRIYRGAESGTLTLLSEGGNVLAYTDEHLPNGSQWHYQVSAVNFVGESSPSNEASGVPRPDVATAPASLLVRPDPAWSEQPRQLDFSYIVAASQCPPSEVCPVAHEWRVYQGGSLAGADGVLLASGANTHAGHAETTTYQVATTIAPTGLDGTHRLKVAVNAREGSTHWRVATSTFQIGVPQPDPTCDADPGYHTYLMPGLAAPNQTGQTYGKTYGYKLDGALSSFRATFVDGCLAQGPTGAGDGFYEIGYGGVLLDRSATGKTIHLLDSSGNRPTFVVGTDVDGSGFLGDSGLDCFQGPHVSVANVSCPADAAGHIVVVLLPSNPVGPLDDAVPLWGRLVPCTRLIDRCRTIMDRDGDGLPDAPTFQPDEGADGLGDAWYDTMDSAAKNIDRLLDASQDQEFIEPCWGNCLNMPRAGDGLANINEFRWLTVPLGPLRAYVAGQWVDILPNARDYDQDRWEDGPEHHYWNDPSNDLALENDAWALIEAAPHDPDAQQNFDNDDSTTLHDPDSDNDGWLDGDEYNTYRTYPEFEDSDCPLSSPDCPAPDQVGSGNLAGTHLGATSDPRQPGVGDLMPDRVEHTAWQSIAPDAWRRDFDEDTTVNNLLDPDSDGDELLDSIEFSPEVGGRCEAPCTSPAKFDTDGDGLLDGGDLSLPSTDRRVALFIRAGIAYEPNYGGYHFYGERAAGTDATRADTDGDKLPDGWEVKYKLDPLLGVLEGDADGDWLTDFEEYSFGCRTSPCPTTPVHWGGTNPRLVDTDGDKLNDGAEPSYGGHPLEPDTDMDGLIDGKEAHVHFTQVADSDSDDDKLTDYQEVVRYAAKAVNPNKANSDLCCNTTDSDALTDYQEIVQYGTKPGQTDADGDGIPEAWDSDGDLVADGRDLRPLSFDSPPQVVPPPTDKVINLSYDSYVVFRSSGYIDVILRDAHEGEQQVSGVEALISLKGQVGGVTANVTMLQEAKRLEDGSTWGARFPLPKHMTSSTQQDYSLLVTREDGATRVFKGRTTQHHMGPREWKAESDTAVGGSGWHSLDSHFSQGEASTPGGGGTSGDSLDSGESSSSLSDLKPWNMSLEQLFERYGEFTVYRLKPLAVLENETAGIPNLSALGIGNVLQVPLGADNVTPVVNASFDVIVYSDAFEMVSPLEELGVYQTQAPGGRAEFRGPRYLWSGLATALVPDPSYYLPNGPCIGPLDTRQCIAFVFGSDDPRAKGALVGEIVAGLLIYGDVRDVYFGVEQRDPLKLALGVFGLATTPVPGLDASAAAFKAEMKVLAKNPALKEFGVRVIRDYADAFRAGDVSPATLLKSSEVLRYTHNNPDKLPDLQRLADAFGESDGRTLRALSSELDNAVQASADLARIVGDAEAKAILKRFTQSSVMYPQGGAEALREIAEVAKVVRANAGLADPDRAAYFLKDVDALLNVDGKNVNAWWHYRAKNHIKAPDNDGWFGYVFEAEQGARLERDQLLVWLDDTLDRVIVGTNPERDVQVDMYRLAEGGKKILTDAKTAKDGKVRATSDNKIQMEAQAAGIIQKEGSRNLKRELHWVVNGDVTDPLRQHSLDIYGNYGVLVRFFDRQGLEITRYVPE